MPIEAIYQRLTEILREVFNDDSLVAEPALTADQVLGWDSFAHLRLMFAIEKAFDINFTGSQISGTQNVGELAQLIQSKVGRVAHPT